MFKISNRQFLRPETLKRHALQVFQCRLPYGCENKTNHDIYKLLQSVDRLIYYFYFNFTAPSQASDNQRNSDSSDHFPSGRITPPATNLPRFKKYTVTDFNFLKVSLLPKAVHHYKRSLTDFSHDRRVYRGACNSRASAKVPADETPKLFTSR